MEGNELALTSSHFVPPLECTLTPPRIFPEKHYTTELIHFIQRFKQDDGSSLASEKQSNEMQTSADASKQTKTRLSSWNCEFLLHNIWL
jgi:hypothetical protein